MKPADEAWISFDELKTWRRRLHSYPELSAREYKTAEFVAKQLEACGLEVHRGIGGTGVVAALKGRGSSARAIGFRADMDALPIVEANEFAHRSLQQGHMHACGHDGHTTMLLGAAKYLANSPSLPGTVYFVFQPAEETGTGGIAMIQDKLFSRFPMQEIYGLHNLPGLPIGSFAFRPGPIMAATDHFDLSIEGSGGHGALPHQARDPTVAAAQVIMAWQSIVSREVNPLDAAVISVTQIHGGNAYNAIPAQVDLAGTVRSFDEKVRSGLQRSMLRIAESICAAHRVRCKFTYIHKNPPTVNSKRETDIAILAAKEVVGGVNVEANAPPLTAGEDFAWMLREKSGCLAFIGNGTSSAHLHSDCYDFNDDALEIGVRYWAALARIALEIQRGCSDH